MEDGFLFGNGGGEGERWGGEREDEGALFVFLVGGALVEEEEAFIS